MLFSINKGMLKLAINIYFILNLYLFKFGDTILWSLPQYLEKH